MRQWFPRESIHVEFPNGAGLLFVQCKDGTLIGDFHLIVTKIAVHCLLCTNVEGARSPFFLNKPPVDMLVNLAFSRCPDSYLFGNHMELSISSKGEANEGLFIVIVGYMVAVYSFCSSVYALNFNLSVKVPKKYFNIVMR